MLDILDNSAAKSGLISCQGSCHMKRDFQTNFSTKWMIRTLDWRSNPPKL